MQGIRYVYTIYLLKSQIYLTTFSNMVFLSYCVKLNLLNFNSKVKKNYMFALINLNKLVVYNFMYNLFEII